MADSSTVILGTLGVLAEIAIPILLIWLVVWFFKKIGEIAATLSRIEVHLAGEVMARDQANGTQPRPPLPELPARRPLRPGLNLDLS
jgi:hypothetical protein